MRRPVEDAVVQGRLACQRTPGISTSTDGRKDWLNLNGVWDVTLADSTTAKILVPYPVESALSGVMKQSERLTYRRTFEVPKAWRGQRVLLHFGAVDWQAEVLVNGKAVGKHEGGYTPFSFEVSGALKKEGPQEVMVKVRDPTDFGTQPRGKQVKNPSGIFYVVAPLTPQAARALRTGKNWIAAHCTTTQTKPTRWQNIDIGLSRNFP